MHFPALGAGFLVRLIAPVVAVAAVIATPAPASAEFQFVTQWGSNASPQPGEFKDPSGVASDAAGNVYVADSSNFRIQKFDSSGTFILQWGSLGSGNGQFSGTYDVATDGAG